MEQPALPSLDAVDGLALWLKPHVLQLLFLLCPGEKVQLGGSRGEQDAHLPKSEGRVPQASSTSHSADLRLTLLLGGRQ